jgi:hypothetical protein
MSAAVTGSLLVQPLKVRRCALRAAAAAAAAAASDLRAHTTARLTTPCTPHNKRQELCIKAVSAGFAERPSFGQLPEASCRRVVDGLPLDLPLELVGAVGGGTGLAQRGGACDTVQQKQPWSKKTSLC